MLLLILFALPFTVILDTTLVTAIDDGKQQFRYTLQEFKDHQGRIQVSLSNLGEATFSGPLTSNSGTCDVQQLKVTGNATVFKNLHVPSGEAQVHTIVVDHQLMAQKKSVVDFYGKVNFGESSEAAASTPPLDHQHHHGHHHHGRHPRDPRWQQPHDVHFLNGWRSSQNVKVEGVIDATSVNVKDHLAVGTTMKAGGKIEAPEIVATDIIQGKTIQAEVALEVKGVARLYQSLSVQSDISTNRNLQVNGTASFQSLVVLSKALLEQDVDVKGSLTAIKSLKSHGDCVVDGTLYVGKAAKFVATVQVPELQASTNVSVGENLSAGGSILVAGDAQIRGNLKAGMSIEALTVKATKMISTPFLNVSSQIDSNFVQTNNLNVSHKAQIWGSLHVSENTIVNGSLQVDQLVGSSIYIKQSMNASSASIYGNLYASSINVSSISVTSQFELVGTQAKPLQSVNGYESSNGSIEVAKNIISHGMVVAKKGLSTSNLTAYGKVTFEGNDTFIQHLQARDLVVSGGDSSSSGIWVKGGANVTIDSPGLLCSKGGLVIENGTMSEFHGDALVTGRFQFTETLKVTGTVDSESVFTSRIYTEDLSARGFVSAKTIVSTGDLDVSKNVNVQACIFVEDRVEANHLVARHSITAPMASLDRISAAAITVQKVMISTELMVQDVNVMQLISKEMKILNDRMDTLERQLSSYIASATKSTATV